MLLTVEAVEHPKLNMNAAAETSMSYYLKVAKHNIFAFFKISVTSKKDILNIELSHLYISFGKNNFFYILNWLLKCYPRKKNSLLSGPDSIVNNYKY